MGELSRWGWDVAGNLAFFSFTPESSGESGKVGFKDLSTLF